MTHEENRRSIIIALGLLIDRHIIWSTDFDSIRPAIALILNNELAKASNYDPNIIRLAHALIEERA